VLCNGYSVMLCHIVFELCLRSCNKLSFLKVMTGELEGIKEDKTCSVIFKFRLNLVK
jgi:hypothetical protein